MPRRCVDPLSSPRRRRPGLGLAGLSLLLAGLGFGGCAQRPQDVAVASHGREYFPASVYGPASRRVVADGQPVPHGGGQYLVGKPYTIAGRTYYPSETHRTQVGNASWYGDAFHGRLTANGEIYDRDGFTAASPIMPLPSYARVTNLRNNYSMIVRVNDRGPYASDRIMDVSRRVAEALDFKRYGTARLKVEYVGRASLAGSDDARLYATLKTDGPATWQGDPTMVAEAAPRAQVASLAPYVPEPPPQVRRAPPPPRVVEAHPREPDVIGEGVERRRSRERTEVATEPTLHWQHGPAPARRDVAYGERPMHGWAPPPASWHARLASVETAPPIRPHAGRLVESPPSRVADRATRHPALPPSRPIDLGTIPGAGSQIRARHEPVRLRMARARDD